MKSPISTRAVVLSALASTLALSACSSEPDGSSAGPVVASFQEPGGTPGSAASTPAGTMTPASGTAAPSNETTQVNQLAPAPPSGTGAGTETPSTPPAPATPPAQPTPPPADMQPPPQTTPPVTGGASAGCGAAQGMPANPTTIANPNTIVTFPPGYDGNTPFPIVFAFHGAGRTNSDMRTVDSRTPGTQLENNYVMAFVKSQGNAWDLATDYPLVKQLITQVLAERCIDTSHIFAMGHSSGAQFIAGMLGDSRARETRFAAVAPVSSNNLNNPAWTPLPTLLIHGLMDQMRMNDLNGAQDIMQYAQANQCSGAAPQPVDIGTCTSLVRKATVNPGCKQYVGCAATTLFCNHNDPNYTDTNGVDTNHGWPCFANQEIFSFFEATR